jgi:hypothetical protein
MPPDMFFGNQPDRLSLTEGAAIYSGPSHCLDDELGEVIKVMRRLLLSALNVLGGRTGRHGRSDTMADPNLWQW